MEFAHPPPVHLANANMSVPPPMISIPGNQMGPNININQNMYQKFDPRSGFNNRPPFRPFLNLQRPLPGPLGNMTLEDFDGKRLRKSVMRKTVDYNAAIITALETRLWQRDYRDRRALQPDVMYYPDMMPPPSYPDNPINCVTTRFVKTATNKMRCPIFCMAWTPEGRRLVTGASSGEFTLWNGLTFNFETILQAHDSPVRCMVWSHNDSWMVTGDHAGYVKYWQSNMNNVKMFQAHKEALRGISFSPTDSKFVTCSDDGTLRIWDFLRYQEERILRGHGADVKCVHWHPQKGLVISGSKDNQQPIKLWDPKTGQSLATLHAHKSTVMDLKWNENGNWLITASRDHLLKLFDLRNLNQEVQTFRGHKKEASSVAWHPVHEGLFCSGGSDGCIMFWHVGADKEVGAIEQAHDSIVWTLAWHPLGHILCSGSNDHTSKFWTRNRPGDLMRDKYNLNTLPAGIAGLDDIDIDEPSSIIPGMGPEDKVDYPVSSDSPLTIPGLDLDFHGLEDKGKAKKVPYSKPIPRNFQAQWNETANTDDPVSNINEMINQLVENTAGVVPLQKIASNANGLIMCGKFVPVEPGSKLEAAIAEGPKFLYEFIVAGQVPELADVLDQIKEEYNNLNQTFQDEECEDIEEVEASEPSPTEDRPLSQPFKGAADQDIRQVPPPLFNFARGDSDMRNTDFRNHKDVDFRQPYEDQDMRSFPSNMGDQDFRTPFNHNDRNDQDYRNSQNHRYQEEYAEEEQYEDEYRDDFQEDFQEDEETSSNWRPNGNFSHPPPRNFNNFNQNFRSNGPSSGPGFRRPPPVSDNDSWTSSTNDNFRGRRSSGGSWRGRSRMPSWSSRSAPRGGPPPRSNPRMRGRF